MLVLAEALEYAGRRLMIHGNLTPGHILIGDDGQAAHHRFRAGETWMRAGRVVCDSPGVRRPRAAPISGRPADGPDRRLIAWASFSTGC